MRYRKCDRCGKRIVSGADFYPAMIKGYLAEEVGCQPRNIPDASLNYAMVADKALLTGLMRKEKKMGLKNKSDTFLVSFDYTHGDIPVLIIGRRGKEKEIDIINAFQGDEASELYKKLTDKKVSG